MLDSLAGRTDVKALVLLSRKPGIFIAGADVNEIAAADRNTDPEFIRGPHRTFLKLANLPFPTVAAIDGACVGGGCETVLSMDWRLASDSPKTQIGLPEIKLGILPAWGGTTRLPRMIGLAGALDVILAGKVLDAKRAKKAGLVDEVVPAVLLEEVAKGYARGKFGSKKRSNAGAGGGPARVREATLAEKFLEGPGKGIVFSKARAVRDEGDEGTLPGSARGARGRREGLRSAIREGARIRGRRRQHAHRHADDAQPRGPLLPDGRGPEGDGGRGARRRGRPAAEDRARRRPRRGRHGRRHRAARCGSRPSGPHEGHQGRRARARLRAGRADLEGKAQETPHDARRVRREDGASRRFARLCGLRDAATSRSRRSSRRWPSSTPSSRNGRRSCPRRRSSRRTRPRSRSRRSPPERRIPSGSSGCTSSIPVYKMPLVEVIYGAKTAPEVTATIFDLAKKMGKTPVVVKDSPGFLVNRILGPYIAEAARLLLEGADYDGRSTRPCARSGCRSDRSSSSTTSGSTSPPRPPRRSRSRLARPHAAGSGAREARRDGTDREKSEEGILFL